VPRVPLFGTRVLGSLPAPLFFLPLNLQLLTFKFRSPTVTFSAQNRSSTTEYYCLVVTDAREWAMLARGLVSLHSPPLLGQKPSLVKSRVSITSKLIESKRLQVLYFGHLRKTGGWGSYGHLTKDVHPEPAEGFFSIFRSFFLGRPALATSVPGAKGHQKFRVDQETREGEKSRSCRLKSPACELGWEKDLGEVLFAGIAPGLKSRPPKDELGRL